MKTIKIFFIFFFALQSFSYSFANEFEDLTLKNNIAQGNGKAEILIGQKKYKDALVFLNKMLADEKFDTQTLFLTGYALRNSGNPELAIEAFSKFLEIKDSPRVHFELAMAYAQVQDAKKSIKHLKIAKKSNTDPKNINAINKMIDSLDNIRRRTSPFYGLMQVGVSHDSNIDYTPTAKNLTIGDLEFDVPSARRGLASRYTALLGHNKEVKPSIYLIGSASASMVDYTKSQHNDRDMLQVALTEGVAYRKNDYEIGASAGYNQLRIGRELSGKYMDLYGTDLYFKKILNKNIVSTTTVNFWKKDIIISPIRKSDSYTIMQQGQFFVSPTLFLTGFTSFTQENAVSDSFTNQRYLLGFNAMKTLMNGKFNVSSGYNVRKANYDAPDLIYQEVRKDTLHTANLNVNWVVNNRLSVGAGLIGFISTSNIEAFEYKKLDTVLTLNYQL